MQFSIPYNGSNPIEYFNLIEPYKDKIHDIFLGLPEFSNHQSGDILKELSLINPDDCSISHYRDNIYKFLELNLSKGYRIYITWNTLYLPLTNDQLESKIKELKVIIQKYKISSIIVTEYIQAQLIHKIIPEVQISTSCNTFQTNTRSMDFYKELGCTLFNPPREVARSPSLLNKLKGYPLKVLVNESCLFGCPQSITHPISISLSNDFKSFDCIRGDLSNIFRSNFILPRWLPKLEDKVEVFKIAGRFLDNNRLKIIFDAYFNLRDDVLLTDILVTGTIRYLKHLNEHRIQSNKKPILIYTKDIPDRLLTCECKCSSCLLCDKLYKKILKRTK